MALYLLKTGTGEDLVWRFQLPQVLPKGRGPGRRSEHSAAAVDGTMFVVGGRSTTTEFKDMYALDTEVDPPVWTEVSYFLSLRNIAFSLPASLLWMYYLRSITFARAIARSPDADDMPMLARKRF